MAHPAKRNLRALVPGSMFDDRTIDSATAIYNPDTEILNVISDERQGGPHTISCPIFKNAEELPSWAKTILESSASKLTPQEALNKIIQTTREPGNAHIIPQTDADTASAAQDGSVEFCLYRDNGTLCAVSTLGVMKVERYDLTRNIFSRNTGILETDIMASKRAVIIGCGSVGSLLAAELARAGVGNFLLIDMDVLEYHNICRHQCGIRDVGRRKPDAVRDLIYNINPKANVETSYTEVQITSVKLLEEWCVSGQTIVFGCADNRDVDRYASDVATEHDVAFMGIGFWERAFAGEVFYWLPNSGHTCYRCAFGSDDGLSQRVEANHHIYTTQTDLAAVNFEPGIAVDIDFVTIVGAKLALDVFNLGDPRFTQRLLPHLAQYTLVCNTNNPAVGGPMAEIFTYPLQVTTSLQVRPLEGCPVCSCQADKAC